MHKLSWIMFLVITGAILAEEPKTEAPKAEAELEWSHNSSYGFARLAKEYERRHFLVEARFYQFEEEGKKTRQGLLGFGLPFAVAEEHVTLTPGAAVIINENGSRGIAPTLTASAYYKGTSVEVIALRNYALKGESRGYFATLPAKVEQQITRRWSLAYLVETTYQEGRGFNEHGPAVYINHGKGRWYAGRWYIGLMTAKLEPEGHEEHLTAKRTYVVRFGRSFIIGGHEE